MFWFGFALGVYTAIITEFITLIILAIKRGHKK